MIFVVGGAGGLSPNNAVIHVTAPVGSTISFAKGGVVAKVLGPEKSHVNADDPTLADWYYSVSSSNYGTWTVTVTLGIDTASETITVSANKQYDLSDMFELMIIDASKLTASQFIDNLNVVGGAVTSIEKQGDELYIPVPWQTSARGFQWKTQLNVTSYNYLVFEGRAYGNYVNDMYFGLSRARPTYAGDVTNIASKEINTTTQSLFIIDISNIQGSCYFGLRIGENRYIYLTKVYCSKEMPHW